MRDTVFFSFVLFLGSQWGIEPHSIPVTEGTITSILSWQLEGWKTHREPQADRLVGTSCRGWDGAKNSLSSSSKHLDEDLAKLFDEILLQVFPNNLDDITKDARTAGRLITWSDVNETHHSPNSFNNSEFASSSHKQEEHLAKIFDEILLQVFSNDPQYLSKEGARAADELATWKDSNENYMAEKTNKESSLFNRDVSHQLTTAAKETTQKLTTHDAHTEGLPCRQMLSFLQKNIIIAATAVASILLVTAFVAFVLVTCLRRKQPRYPPANTTYNIFIMNGKGWWQKPEERLLRKFTGKQKTLRCKSCV
ncbi:uncharacterized protein C2orf92 homolog isoform X2 [Mesocricetus auratus]|uniref:Uncharacterized protein C2orf92 homolog isoform X2 n=1 Tax=Mesocricetus auratus TaxID=10036 RepID=A0ABM2W664_MESAU|nr:uncharacterized protein C2orf92 homolog isoform X2 [Mesocricetus auratus]